MSNRYDEYEKKIANRAKVLRFFYEMRFIFIIIISASICTAAVLVSLKGVTIDYKRVAKKYTYGETIKYKSASLFDNPIYEFSEQDKNNWTKETPTLVGKYKLRAKAKNSFSTYYKGNVQKFEIVPKTINIIADENQITYGEMPTIRIGDQLMFGDSLNTDYTFTYSDKTKNIWSVSANKESLHVYSTTGEDVTNCYSFNIVTKDISILKRQIKIKTSSASKVYDGQEFESKDFEIESGSLAPGDTINLVDWTKATNVSVIDNAQSFKITDGDNADMTSHYDIVLDNGTLEIKEREISFATSDYEFTYDGKNKKFSLDDVEYDSDELATGDEVTISYANDDSFVNAGSYENEFKVKITSGDVDVTSNYNIDFDFGTTTIAKQALKIKGASSTKTYDSVAIKNDSFSLEKGTIADKDEMTISSEEYVDAGTYENKLTVSIKDKDSQKDMISNYDIEFENGEIKINKVDLEVNINQNTVTYDGLPHTNTYTLVDGDLAGSDYLEIKTNLEKTEAGTYDNEDLELIVKTSEDVDNSKNYNITYNGRDGALVINKRPLTIEALSKDKTYDSLSLRNTMTDDTFYTVTDGTLAANEYISFQYLNDATNAGVYPIESEIKIYHQVGESKDVDNDLDVTSNYDIDYINGDFTINKRNITVQTIDAEHQYNRNPAIPTGLSVFSVTAAGDGLVEGQTIKTFDITCPGINVGVYDYVVDTTTFAIEDENGNDVTANYNVTFINNGKLTISKRELNVTMTEKHWIYDGTSHSSTLHTVTGLIEDDYLTFDGVPSVKHVFDGHIQNNPTSWKAFMFDGTEVTTNYNVTYITNGDVYIDPRPIKLKSPDIEKTFDGEPITPTDLLTITEGSLAPGDTITLNSMESRDNYDNYIHVGNNPNTFAVTIKNGDDLNVTGDYDITFDYGDIVIYPCPITLDIYQNKYIYDGANHNFVYSQNDVTTTTPQIYIVAGTMPAHYHLNVTASISNMKNVGTYDNYVTDISIVPDSPYTVQDGDFQVTFNTGSQQIIHRPITIKTLGGYKVFDEQPFGYGLDPEDLFWIEDGSLAPGHTMYGYTINQIVNVCENQDHVISNVKVKDEYNQDVTSNYVITYIFGKVTIYEE